MEGLTEEEINESLNYIFSWAYFGLCERTIDFKKSDKEFKKHKKRILNLIQGIKPRNN